MFPMLYFVKVCGSLWTTSRSPFMATQIKFSYESVSPKI